MREELLAVSSDEFDPARLELAIQKIAAFEPDGDADAHIEQYVWIIQALLHHSRIGGLKNSEINRLAQLARQLLSLYRVNPDNANVGDFFADLAQVMSHVEYSRNRPWISMWELETARQFRSDDSSAQASVAISRGVRLFKLGFLDDAERLFGNYIHFTDPAIRQRAVLAMARLSRWRYELASASRWIDTAEIGDMLPAIALEFEWERILQRAILSRDIRELLEVFQPKSNFYSEIYVLESNLWCLALNPNAISRDKPTMLQLQNRRNLRLMTCPEIYESLKHFEICSDSETSRASREGAAQKIFELSFEMSGTDAPPLTRVALAHWLRLSGQHDKIELIRRSLRSLSPNHERTLWIELLG